MCFILPITMTTVDKKKKKKGLKKIIKMEKFDLISLCRVLFLLFKTIRIKIYTYIYIIINVLAVSVMVLWVYSAEMKKTTENLIAVSGGQR